MLSSPYRALPILAAAFTLVACKSVEWQEMDAGVPTQWGPYTVRDAGGAFVLATSSDAANEGYLELVELIETIEGTGELMLPKGLLIARSNDDPPLVQADVNLRTELVRLHNAAIGAPAPRYAGPQHSTQAPDEFAAMMPFGIPIDDTTLGLPSALLDRVAWALAVPTRSSVEATVSARIDEGLSEELSFFQRLLVAPFMPSVRSGAVDMMRAETLPAVCDVLL